MKEGCRRKKLFILCKIYVWHVSGLLECFETRDSVTCSFFTVLHVYCSSPNWIVCGLFDIKYRPFESFEGHYSVHCVPQMASLPLLVNLRRIAYSPTYFWNMNWALSISLFRYSRKTTLVISNIRETNYCPFLTV